MSDHFEVSVGDRKEKVYYKDIPDGSAGILPDMVKSPGELTIADMVNQPPHTQTPRSNA